MFHVLVFIEHSVLVAKEALCTSHIYKPRSVHVPVVIEHSVLVTEETFVYQSYTTEVDHVHLE